MSTCKYLKLLAWVEYFTVEFGAIKYCISNKDFIFIKKIKPNFSIVSVKLDICRQSLQIEDLI